MRRFEGMSRKDTREILESRIKDGVGTARECGGVEDARGVTWSDVI